MSVRERRDRPLRVVMPIVVLALGVAAWQAVVQYKDIPPYVLPAPDLIAQTFATEMERLYAAQADTDTDNIKADDGSA